MSHTSYADGAAAQAVAAPEPTSAVALHGVLAPPPAFDWPGEVDLEVSAGDLAVIATLPSLSVALLRLVIGLRQPVRGRLLVLGEEPGLLARFDGLAFRRRLGVAFQLHGLISNLDLRTNLLVPLLYSGADPGSADELVSETLDACGIRRWAERRPADAPPEVRQVAALARALVRRPELLLLEAPFRSLRRERAMRLLELCRERARTVVVVETEHEPWLFERADSLIVLDEKGVRGEAHEVGIG